MMTPEFIPYALLIIGFISTIFLAWKIIDKRIKRRRRILEEELAAQQESMRVASFANNESEQSYEVLLSTDKRFLRSAEIERNNMITVTEIAKIESKPDTVVASIALRNREKDYHACQTGLDTRTKKLTEKFRNLNLPDLFIASSEFRIFPDFNNDRKIFNKRFNGSHEFTVKFGYTTESLNSFYSTLFDIESNAELDLSFQLSEIDLAKKNAIALAIQKATSTARAVAQSAQIQLGAVSSIRPHIVVGRPQRHRFGGPEQILMREAALRVADEGGVGYTTPSIEAGELEVVASVTMRFRIII